MEDEEQRAGLAIEAGAEEGARPCADAVNIARQCAPRNAAGREDRREASELLGWHTCGWARGAFSALGSLLHAVSPKSEYPHNDTHRFKNSPLCADSGGSRMSAGCGAGAE